MAISMSEGPLAGLRVLDLAGPTGVYCGRLMADLGADVVRVEPPTGDASREVEPFYQQCAGVERSLFHWQFNANKRGVTLDMDEPAGRDRLLQLARSADVLIETFAPGHLDQLGLAAQTLLNQNPRLVVASITPFGQDGPHRDYVSSELVTQAAGGLLFLCGWPDRPPVMMGGFPAMLQVSAEAACAILLALEDREQTGRGQHVDVSAQQSLPLAFMARMAEYVATGHARGRLGDYHPGPLNGMFRCADGWADFRFRGRPGRWEKIVKWLDSYQMAEDLTDEKWRSPAFRRQPENQQHIDDVFQRFIVQFPTEEAMETAQRTAIEVGAVYSAREILAEPQLRARSFFVSLEDARYERSFTYAGAPYVLSESPWRLSRRAPSLGEHNDEVFRDWSATKPETPSAQGEASGQQPPLAGIRVVDFTQHAAGPLAAKMLADYGAEVIQVESESYLETGGGSRQSGPPGMSPVNTAFFHNKMNTNKLSVTIDLTQEGGRDVVKRLLAISDVMIANVRPHVLENWGLTYDVLSKLNPRLIFVTMPTMGAGGPRSFYGGVSWGIQAMAGLNAISGYPDRPPVSPSPYSHPDVSCNPLHAAFAILAALRHRRRTGKGQLIELSQYESSVAWLGLGVLAYDANGALLPRAANDSPYAAPHDAYRCQGEDRWCAIAVHADEQWRTLCEVIGRADLADAPSFRTLAARRARPEELRAIVEAWTSERTAEEVTQTLQARGVPAYVVNGFEDLLRLDPQLQHRQAWTEVEHPELGVVAVEDWAFKLSRSPRVPPQRAPLFGEHNDYVFQEVLEMSEDEVNDLLVEGVLR